MYPAIKQREQDTITMLKKLLIFTAVTALTLDYGVHAENEIPIPALAADSPGDGRSLLEITRNVHRNRRRLPTSE